MASLRSIAENTVGGFGGAASVTEQAAKAGLTSLSAGEAAAALGKAAALASGALAYQHYSQMDVSPAVAGTLAAAQAVAGDFVGGLVAPDTGGVGTYAADALTQKAFEAVVDRVIEQADQPVQPTYGNYGRVPVITGYTINPDSSTIKNDPQAAQYARDALANRPPGISPAAWAAALNNMMESMKHAYVGPDDFNSPNPADRLMQGSPVFTTTVNGPDYTGDIKPSLDAPLSVTPGSANAIGDMTPDNRMTTNQFRDSIYGGAYEGQDRPDPSYTGGLPNLNSPGSQALHDQQMNSREGGGGGGNSGGGEGAANNGHPPSSGGGNPGGGGGNNGGGIGGDSTTGGGSPANTGPGSNPTSAPNSGSSGGYNNNEASYSAGYPILLDLSGQGFNITELSRSNTFLDTAGSGLSHRTAWAGVGTGVLFYDVNGTGSITQKNEYVFTEWDPTAKDDMQALRNVFDTNGDGKFDSSDAKWLQFKVMVTNADGTTSALTMAQAGITSINLKADTTNIRYSDGSAITGETTFTKSNGGTGTVATTTLATDVNGYAVATTSSTDGSGTVTLTHTGTSADGSVAFVETSVTTASGSSRILTYDDNGDGVIDRRQVITKTTDGSGNVTEVWTNFNGGGIKLSAVQTVTSADGKTVTISRDKIGGGWFDQTEARVTNVDGSRSVTVTNLNSDGSEITRSTTAQSVDGLTKTVSTDLDSDGLADRITTDTLVNNGDGSRSEAVSIKSINGTFLTAQSTAISADGKTQTISTDHMGSGTADAVLTTVITANGDGTSTSTLQSFAHNGAYIDGQTVTTSADGLSTTTVQDLDGWHYADRTTTDNVTINTDGSRDDVLTVTSLDGSVLYKSTSHLGADQLSKTVSIDALGIGINTVTEVVAVNATTGIKTDTTSILAPNLSLLNQAVVTSSADGLSKTTTVDLNGDGAVDSRVTDVTVKNGNGSATETMSTFSNTSALMNRQTNTTSADGLTVTLASDLDGNGTTDHTTTDQKVNNSDGSVTETVTDSSGNGSLLHQTVTQISADRKSVTVTDYGVHTVGAANVAYVDRTESIVTASNGTVTDLTTNFAINGSLINRSESVATANGLSTTTYYDLSGHGTSWDGSSTDATYYTADGVVWNHVASISANGTVLSLSDTGVASWWSKVLPDFNGDATPDRVMSTAKQYWADGSTSTFFSVYNGAQTTKLSEVENWVSGTGLNKYTTYDFNGDGVIDQDKVDNLVYNADGSTTETLTSYTGTSYGTVREVTTSTANVLVAGIGRKTTTTHQSNGSVSYYSVDTVAPLATGEIDDTLQTYSAQGGTLLRQTKQAVSGNGLTVTNYSDVNGDGVWDYWITDAKVVQADGSTAVTASLNNSSGMIAETVTNISGNGLNATISTDANGALSAGNPVFNMVVTDNTVVNADGSRVETVTAKAQNGSTTVQSVITLSADRLTKTTNRYLNETGTITHLDQSDVLQTNTDGSLTETLSTWGANAALLSTIVTATSANGLASTTTYKNGSGTVTDTQSSTTTIALDGSHSTVFTDSDVGVSGKTLATSRTIVTSGNGLLSTTTLGLSGALATGMATSYNTGATATTSYLASGAETTTVADTVNSAASDTETITVSANGLTTTTSLQQQGAASAFYQDQYVINLDGSTTEVETFYNPSALSTILEQSTTNMSWDGRTTVASTLTDYDAPASQIITINHTVDNNSATTVTPSFATTYNTLTDTFTRNADDSTTDQRSGSGAFGTGAYSQTTNWTPNINASESLTTANYDSNGFVLGRSTRTTAPNDLAIGMAMDYTGLETVPNLSTAAANLAAGTAVSGLLASDTIASQATVLNADGTTTTTTQFQLANSGSPILLEKSVTTVSANGLVTTTKVDNDGNGLFERIEVKTVAPDGSLTDVNTYYGNASGNNTTVAGSNTYTESATGLISTLTTSTGISDTTVDFAEGNGSRQWSRVVTVHSAAATYGYKNSWATHYINANGMDTWTDFDGIANITTSLVIDKKLESQYLSDANKIAQTILGHGLDNAQQEYVSHFISNNVLNREQLAYWLVTSSEYANNFQIKYTSGANTRYTASVIPFFENVLGRLPNAEELAVAHHYLPIHNPNDSQPNYVALAQAAVAVAQYAAEYELSNNKVVDDTNVSLLLSDSALNPTAPSWLANGSNAVQLQTSGTYTYSGTYIVDMKGNTVSVSITLNGNGNIIIVPGQNYGTITVNGVNNTIEVNGNGTIAASNAEILVDGGSVTITGNYDEIVAAAGTTITDSGNYNTLSAATGSTIYLGTNSTDIIDGSGLTINLANGDKITASHDTISLNDGATVTVIGNNNTFNVRSNDALTLSGSSETVQYGASTGNDSLYGFSSTDIIQFSHLTFANWAALQGAMAQVGADTVITLHGSDKVTLKGVTSSSLVSSEFRFA
jgi:hypothetical protein